MPEPEQRSAPAPPLEVVIAGGGVAGLEAAFALKALAGDRVHTTIVAPGSEFVYRPMSVAEPFSTGWAQHYDLDGLAAQAGAHHIDDRVISVDADRRHIYTSAGSSFPYDALILALGAQPHNRYPHATPIDDARMDELLHGLVQDIEDGYVRELAVVVPAPAPWPLPAYELALLCSERAWDTQVSLKVTLFTPEERPLSVFGLEASLQLSRLLAERHIEVVTSAYCEVPRSKEIIAHPGNRSFSADRIIALPELSGPGLEGVPQDGGGFIPIDEVGSVPGLERVWAAGDGTDFAIRHGGVAAQLADVVAQDVATLAGVGSRPAPFEPVLEGVLLTGGSPRYVRAHPTGGHGADLGLIRLGRADAPPKVAAKYLGPHLQEPAAGRARQGKVEA